MRTYGRAGISADPTLDNFRKIAAGQRVRLWCSASAADQASLVAMLGGTELCSRYVPIEKSAGLGADAEDVPFFDVMSTVEADLVLDFSFGTATVDFILAVDP